MKKLFVIFIKYMPIIQMMGILFTNIIFWFKLSNRYTYILNYVLGNSLLVSILLIIMSYLFGFCKWHRVIIIGNLINITIEVIDKTIGIPISNLEILVLYNIISILFLFISLYLKFSCKNEERCYQNIGERITECC